MFDGLRRRLPRLGPRRATVETGEMLGLDRAIVELGGLPDDGDDDLPPPPTFGRKRRDLPPRPLPSLLLGQPDPLRERAIEHPRPQVPDVDIGVVEPEDWASGEGKAPSRGPCQELARR